MRRRDGLSGFCRAVAVVDERLIHALVEQRHAVYLHVEFHNAESISIARASAVFAPFASLATPNTNAPSIHGRSLCEPFGVGVVEARVSDVFTFGDAVLCLCYAEIPEPCPTVCKQYDGFCRTAPRYGVILTSGGGMFFRNRRQHRTLPALHTQACEFEKIVRQVDFAASVGVRPQHALRKSSPIRDYVQRSSQQHPPAASSMNSSNGKCGPLASLSSG